MKIKDIPKFELINNLNLNAFGLTSFTDFNQHISLKAILKKK